MTTSAAIAFLVAKLFLRFRAAVWLALSATAAGWIAFIAMLFAQAPFYPNTLTGNQPETYLGTAAAIGLVAAVAAGWFAARATQRR